MNSVYYELIATAVAWLRYERRCILVCTERTPFHHHSLYRPDIIGVTRDRRVIEIEVVKKATSDRRSTKLSPLQIGRMVKHQTATLQRALLTIANLSKENKP